MKGKIFSRRGRTSFRSEWEQPIKIEVKHVDQDISRIYLSNGYDKIVLDGNMDNEVFKDKVKPLIDKIIKIVNAESWK